MLKKKAPFFILVSVVVLVAVVLAGTLRPMTASAAEYMQLSKESRMEYAQERYAEFAANPDKKYEILISFNEVPYTEIATLLSGQSNIISAFHCFEANGECAMGGYTECEGKLAEQVIEDYYASIYNLVVGQIESYDDYVRELKKSFGADTDFSADIDANKSEDADANKLEGANGKVVDTSPIEVSEESKKPTTTLEDALKDAEHSLAQFLLQKEAMDNGNFHIYGIRIVMTGAEIDALLSSNTVALVEILNFDNNSLITPIR